MCSYDMITPRGHERSDARHMLVATAPTNQLEYTVCICTAFFLFSPLSLFFLPPLFLPPIHLSLLLAPCHRQCAPACIARGGMSSSSACELADSLRNSLTTLLDAHQCPICYSVFVAPVRLPCNHLFCSLCIRRHLHSVSACPFPDCNDVVTISKLHPLREYDTALAPLRRAIDSTSDANNKPPANLPPRIVFVAKRGAQYYSEKLQQFDLPVSGGVAQLEARFRELALLWNANLDAAVPRSKRTVANALMAAERRRKNANAPLASTFFSASSASKVDSAVRNDADAAEQGDDFATLIAKAKRKRKAAKLLADAQQAARPKRPRTTTKVESTVCAPSSTTLPESSDAPMPVPSHHLQPPAAHPVLQPPSTPHQPMFTSPLRASLPASLPSPMSTPLVSRTTSALHPSVSPSPAAPISSVSDCASPTAPQPPLTPNNNNNNNNLSEEQQKRIELNRQEALRRQQQRRAEKNLEEARRRKARFYRRLNAQMRQPKF